MVAGPDRVSRSAIGLTVVGVILVLVAVAVGFAYVRPALAPPSTRFPDAGSARASVAAAVGEGSETGLDSVILAEENEPLLESVVATLSPTSTVEATGVAASVLSTVVVAAPAAGSSVSNDPGGTSGTGTHGQSGSGTDPGSGGSNPGGSGSDPVVPPARATGLVTGRISHAVWGTGLHGVLTSLSSGSADLTDSGGEYSLVTPSMTLGSNAVYALTVDAARSGLKSYSPTVRTVAVGAGGRIRADFTLYHASESGGTDWRTASWWSHWRGVYSVAQMNALLARVSYASSHFPSMSASAADSVLAARSSGSAREKARAEHLALWLDLASSRLGFDTRTTSAYVRGWGSVGGGGALSLARQLDAVFSSGADVNWVDVRKACSGDTTGG